MSARQVAVCRPGDDRRIDRAFQRWVALFDADNGAAADPEGGAEAVLSDAFALDVMASEILEEKWTRLVSHEQEQFRRALLRALRRTLLPYFGALPVVPALRPAAEEWVQEEGYVRARYWLVDEERSDWFTLRLATHEDGGCAILDVRGDGRSLLDSIDDRVDRALDDYSFPYMIAELGGYDRVVLEDFEDEDEGTLPRDWTWRDQDKDKNKPYRIRIEDGNRYLEATDHGESVIIGHELPWNLDEFPYVSFRVRVNRIPEGGDERDDKKVDSAAGIYFTLNKRFFGQIPQSVKYVWSSTLPVGAAVRRDGIGRPWQVAFGSGQAGLGEWRTYVFDARQAYRDTFGGNAPRKTVGIGVLSDANSLKSQAYADYDDIVALRDAPDEVTSGVLQIMPPIRR